MTSNNQSIGTRSAHNLQCQLTATTQTEVIHCQRFILQIKFLSIKAYTHTVIMSSLYPSLEDMKVDQMQAAQQNVAQQMAAAAQAQPITYPQPGAPGTAPAYAPVSLYPSLDDYMGLDLALVRQTTPQNQQVRLLNL